MNRNLRTIRIAVSLIVTVSFTALTALGTIAAAETLGWSARLQIFPLTAASALLQLILWLALTLIFGRIYCSMICPLGTLQDIFFSLRHIRQIDRRLPRMRHVPANSPMRLGILGAALILMIIGADTVAMILEPVRIYTRFVSLIRTPEAAYPVLAGASTAAALILVAAISLRRGRIWCNTVCPLGTALSLISSRSRLTVNINPDYCTACGKCQEVCKAQCIDLQTLRIDNSRCILCFNCMNICPDDAITYSSNPPAAATPLLQRTNK